jgi:glutamate-ammonia-ligase adenylyltransferase
MITDDIGCLLISSYTVRMRESCPRELITTPVQETAVAVFAHWQAAHPELQKLELVQRWLEPLFAVSPYLQQTCRRYPEDLAALLNSSALVSAPVPAATRIDKLMDAIRARAEALEEGDADTRQVVALRQIRHREMVRILWRDLTGIAGIDDTLADLTALADACIRTAADWAHTQMQSRFGEPRNDEGRAQRLIVLGMGKLGGGELNVSSDIDLIYVYPDGGKTDGKRRVENSEFFRRVAQRLTQLLGSISEDGFVYRVDTRLRPFGESGPLVTSFDGLENYYLTQARDWERYAMIKARPITGDVKDCAALMDLAQPFIYRRYLDYNAIDSLRDLKRKIALAVQQRGMADNIKLGAGGIREIEFTGQAFQLVRGGREQRLRCRPIKQVLGTLAELGLMSEVDVEQLKLAYDFLRRVENALQMMRDQQVHSLPADEDDRLRLLTMLDYADWTAFKTVLDVHQQVVKRCFAALFSDTDASGQSAAAQESEDTDLASARVWSVLSSLDMNADAHRDALREFGIEPSDALLESLSSLTRGGFYQRLTAQSQERIDRILPKLLDAALAQASPVDTLLRTCGLVRAVAGRSGYLQVLVEQPAALARLVRLYARSSWVAEFVTRHPIVIDELLGHSATLPLPDAEMLRQAALAEAKRLLNVDLEQQMDAMRQFQQARELRIAVAELDEELPLMRVSDQLTWLAEAMIEAVMLLVTRPLEKRYGAPTCRVDGELLHPGVGIVAYGKLGGLELGYGSDLDLVFVHESAGEQQQTDAAKPIDNALYYARLAQKMVSFMTTLTPAGVLYDIDLRLRPNGQSGVLVTGLDAFDHYQHSDAWTWEHQALVRARMVVGSAAVRRRFAEIRRNVLRQPREHADLQLSVADMRQRMRDNLGSQSADTIDLKQDAGGVADIEFMVQYLVLAHAAGHPSLVEYTDNVRVLEAAEHCGVLSADDRAALTSHYVTLRAMIHRQALQKQDARVAPVPALEALRKAVIGLWQQLLPSQTRPDTPETSM